MVGGKSFLDNLGKIYAMYTGGFIVFVILLAIGEQMGMSNAAITWQAAVADPRKHLPADLARRLDSTIAKSWQKLKPQRRQVLELLSELQRRHAVHVGEGRGGHRARDLGGPGRPVEEVDGPVPSDGSTWLASNPHKE